MKNLTTHENLKADKKKLQTESGSVITNVYNRVFRRWGFPSIIAIMLSLEQSGNKIEATGLTPSPRRKFDGNTCGDWRRTLLDFLRPVPHKAEKQVRTLVSASSVPIKPRLISEPSRGQFSRKAFGS